MRTTAFTLIIFLFIILFSSCRSNDKVIVLEERDPIVKTLTEKDSLVVYPRDTLKNKNPEKNN